MKRNKLIKELSALGFKFDKHGSKHDHYSNSKRYIAVPRHKTINVLTAHKIIKEAKTDEGI